MARSTRWFAVSTKSRKYGLLRTPPSATELVVIAWAGILLATALTASAAEPAAASIPPTKRWTNSIGMNFVRIEPGGFTMGTSEPGKAAGDFDERPAHRVAISQAFLLGTTEVTNAQYEQYDPAHRALRGKLGFSKNDDEAVVFVSWNDAAGFCLWLAKKEGRPYRLPTEAEWEFACRAGTTTPYSTGPRLVDPAFLKNVGESWFPDDRKNHSRHIVALAVAKTPANPWGLFDMHGNVEEWCADWYGPYEAAEQTDPVGRVDGDFRVTRGGSHSTTLEYLRAANRAGTLPDDKSWLIGFRVAMGPAPSGKPLSAAPSTLCHRDVKDAVPTAAAPPADRPYFRGPRVYVKIPANSEGPLFSRHNHDPAIVDCLNGDLLAIWYTCRTEAGRELGLAASRLRAGREEWDEASPFWDAPDRNDHAPALWRDQQGTLYHFVGLSAAASWANLAIVLRTSRDSGATWSKARLIAPEHGLRHQPVESVFSTKDGAIVLACDAVPGGTGGTAVQVSRDGGKTWRDPGAGRPAPKFTSGGQGAWIAGIHAGVAEMSDGRWLALGRGDNIEGRMPRSVSADRGATWTYSPGPFPPIGGGQRLVLLRLREGPLFLASFAKRIDTKDAAGRVRKCSGLFGALSHDDGVTWPHVRLITDDGRMRRVEGGGNTGAFLLGPESAEPAGYLSVCQSPDGVIHLISSKNHYAMNVAWLKTAPPATK